MSQYLKVQYELLRPSEIKALREACPVIYIPVGSLEWHGVHNPLGTDGLKAHAVCCEAALKYGGVVHPPLYHGIMYKEGEGWGPEGYGGYTINCHDQKSLEEYIYRFATSIVANGWRVLVGVTGHDVDAQRDAIHDAIQRACLDTDSKGFAVTEGENWDGGASLEYCMDHAATWETSIMMRLTGERVYLDELREQMEASSRADLETTEMLDKEGIGGQNPLKYASAELGEQIIRFCAERIGRKAIDVLQGRAVPPQKADTSFMDNPGPTD